MKILALLPLLCLSASAQFATIYTTNSSPLKGAWARMETNFATAATMIAAKADTSALTSATNTLNTSLRAALAQTNVFDGRNFTNIGTVGHPGAGVSSFLTNGGIVWFVTNAAPGNTVLPNGSFSTPTDGTFWVRTNSTWVRK